MIAQDSPTAAVPEASALDVAEMFERARQAMLDLDAALEAIGSTRKPARRTDRAPSPPATFPIFDPAVLSY